MLSRISILLAIVAAVALAFASDVFIWHVLSPGFKFTCVFAFYFGATLSFLAFVLAFINSLKHGRNKPSVRICVWSAVEFLAFGFVYLYAIFSA